MINAHACDHCAVRHRALCGALSADELKRLNKLAFTKVLSPGELIMSDSEEPEFFANIVRGVVKLTKVIPDGRQQIVGLQFASDFIGRPYAARIPFFAEAASEVELCCFRKRQFEELMSDIPELEHRMFQHTLDELDAARNWMLLLGRKSAAERIASFLLMVAQRATQIGCAHTSNGVSSAIIELPLTRAEIADYLGLTIETVSRQFSKLKAEGAISVGLGRSISVPDIDRLAEIAGGDIELEVESAAL